MDRSKEVFADRKGVLKGENGTIVKDTKVMTFYNVPVELFESFKEYARIYADGNWRVALAMLLQEAHWREELNFLMHKIEELDSRVAEIEGRLNTKIRTFGGEFDVSR